MPRPVDMNRKDLLIFLGLELFAIVWAGTVFTVLERKIVAGALAGGYFVISGLFMLWRASRWPAKWKSLTMYLLIVHVLGIALPMLISRFVQVDESFENVKVLGLPGPVFHELSTYVFTGLICATLIDLWRARKSR